MILAAAERGELENFAVDRARLEPTADYVAETVRRRYPDLDIPFHARWRHFTAGGFDRWAALAERLAGGSGEEIARTRFDLAEIGSQEVARGNLAIACRQPPPERCCARLDDDQLHSGRRVHVKHAQYRSV